MQGRDADFFLKEMIQSEFRDSTAKALGGTGTKLSRSIEELTQVLKLQDLTPSCSPTSPAAHFRLALLLSTPTLHCHHFPPCFRLTLAPASIYLQAAAAVKAAPNQKTITAYNTQQAKVTTLLFTARLVHVCPH
jgi:hypothetical protein